MVADFDSLARALAQDVCVVGLGAAGRGEDSAGREVLARLGPSPDPVEGPRAASRPRRAWLAAGLELERYLHRLTAAAFAQVVFVDAVEAGQAPGTLVVLGGMHLWERFPQCSTHRLSLGLVARLLEASGGTQVWLLGIQRGEPSAVQPAVAAAADWLRTQLRPDASVPAAISPPLGGVNA